MENNILSDEIIFEKIYLIRGYKAMLDRDLALLYGEETRRINENVKRNINRFPEDFMFQLNEKELKNLMSQIAISSWGGMRKHPYAFTEHGVLMLSSVLNSKRAIQVNIQIMRIFLKMREILTTNKELYSLINKIENQISKHDKKIVLIFKYLKQLEQTKKEDMDFKKRKRIGY